MDAFEKLKDAISKIEDPQTKNSMDALVGELNKQKGTALADLNATKDKLKSKESDTKTLTEVFQIFKDAGVEVSDNKQILEVAKQLGNKVDDSASLDEMSRLLEESLIKNKDLESLINSRSLQDAIFPKLESALSEFKDKDGKPIRVIKDFIDRDALIKDLDPTQEPLVEKRIGDTLQAAAVKTAEFMSSNGIGFEGSPTHSAHIQDNGIANRSTGIAQDAALNVWNREGSAKTVGDAAQAIAAARNASQDAQ